MAADSKRTSIIGRLNSTTRSIAIALLIPALVSLGMMFLTTMRYQSSMSRMARAAALKPVVGAELPEQLFSVVAGRMRYGDSGVDDLDKDSIEIFRREAVKNGRMTKKDLSISNEELLDHSSSFAI